MNNLRRLIRDRSYREAITAADSVVASTPVEKAEVYLYRTQAMLALGEYDDSYVTEATRILRPLGDFILFAFAKYLTGRLQIQSGNLTDAAESLNEAYVYYKRAEDSKGMAQASNLLSWIAFRKSDYSTFFRLAERCTRLYRDIEAFDKIDEVSMNCAMAHIRLGDLGEGRRVLDSLRKGHSHFSNTVRANFRHMLAILHAQMGNLRTAAKDINSSESKPSALKRERCRCFEVEGYVRLLAGQYKLALLNLNAGLSLAQEIEIAPESALISQIKRLFGDLYVATQKWKLAEKYAREALAVAEKINERLEIAACYRVFAQVEHHRNNDDKARDWYKKAIDLFNLIGSRYELAVTRYLAATSGLYHNGERMAMLYLAREYFELEKVRPYMKKVDAAIKASPVDKAKAASAQNNGDTPKMIVASPAMKKIVEFAEHVAQSQMNILLTGETGSGKDLLARYIHWASGRKGEFVSINCAAIPNERVEAELFGHIKGSYTGAIADRPGLIEQAENGTLYLNEIADATPEFQAKLLEVLETRMVRRLGSNSVRKVSFRLIAATNHDLQQRMRDNLFRQDLYHRLNDIPMTLPPLSQRCEDFEPLVRHFLTEAGMAFNGDTPKIDRLATMLASSEWPGNVRQLRASLRTLYLSSHGDVDKMLTGAAELIATSQRDRLLAALEQSEWNRTRAAEMFGVSEGTIRNWIRRYEIAETAGVEA